MADNSETEVENVTTPELELENSLDWSAEPVVLYATDITDFTLEVQNQIRETYLTEDDDKLVFYIDFNEDDNKYRIDVRYTKVEITTPPTKAFLEAETVDAPFRVRNDGLFEMSLADPSKLETLNVVSYDPDEEIVIAGTPQDLLPEYYSSTTDVE